MLDHATTPLCACGCGAPIVPQPHHRRHGTPRYRQGHYSKTIAGHGLTTRCPVCGTVSHDPPSARRVYCSYACMAIGYRTHPVKPPRQPGQRRPDATGGDRPCHRCGTIVWVSPYKLARDTRHFCSRACYFATHNEWDAISAAGERKRRATFLARSHNQGPKNGMSGRTGAAHPQWRGGVARYSRGRKHTNWARAVKHRDGHACQGCGKQSRRLHAHHLLRWRDYPDRRFDLSNGITVCAACHRALHSLRGAVQLSLL